jgi:mono/diheme cytochrome c family protein
MRDGVLPWRERYAGRRSATRGPRIAQAYISATVSRGVTGSGMPAFSASLPAADLTAVVAYVATLNGIADSDITVGSPVGNGRSAPVLIGDAARGAQLFKDDLRGFARCSTCHQVGGVGIPVAPAIGRVPASVADLKAMATPEVKTVIVDGDAAPALVLSDGSKSTAFYDLASVAPVLRYIEPGAAKFIPNDTWRHSSVISSYNDADLASILNYLRVAVAH